MPPRYAVPSTWLLPPFDALVVFAAGVNPVRLGAAPFQFPERRARFQVIHQELGCLKRRLAMRGRDADKDNAIAWHQFAGPVHNPQSENGPAFPRLRGMHCDFAFAHAGIMVE